MIAIVFNKLPPPPPPAPYTAMKQDHSHVLHFAQHIVSYLFVFHPLRRLSR